MTELRLDADALARHVIRRGRDAKSLRPVGFRLDSEGINLAVTLPGPDYLAALLTLPGVDAYRVGAGLLARPQGSDEEPEALDLPALATGLRAALAALPERADAGEAYADVRLAASTPSALFGAYVLDVVRAYVRSLPALPKRAKHPQERRSAKTPEERLRAHRVRKREEVRASASWALATFLADEEDGPAPASGTRVAGADLYAYASQILAAAVEEYDDVMRDAGLSLDERRAAWEEIRQEFLLDAPRRPRPVSRRVLYATAEEHGHRVTRPGNAVVVTVVRRLVARLKESTVNALRLAYEILGTGPADPELRADAAVRDVLSLAPATRPESLDPRVLALPRDVAFAIAGVPASDVRRTFVLMAREHLRRHPGDRPNVVPIADALRAGDPDELVAQIRGMCADALLAGEALA